MKTKQYLKELRQLSVADLKTKLSNLQEESFKLRCKKVIGQITDTSTLNKIKKDIARIKTILASKK